MLFALLHIGPITLTGLAEHQNEEMQTSMERCPEANKP